MTWDVHVADRSSLERSVLTRLLTGLLLPRVASSGPGTSVLNRQPPSTSDPEAMINMPTATRSPSWLPDPTGLVVRWIAFRHSVTGLTPCPCWICVTPTGRHDPEPVLPAKDKDHMSFTTPNTVPSGMSVRVLDVDGHQPHQLQDFLREVSFVIDLDPPVLVHGVGRVDGQTVRFHEKDVDHSGKDIRVWEVRAEDDGRFVAQHAAQF